MGMDVTSPEVELTTTARFPGPTIEAKTHQVAVAALWPCGPVACHPQVCLPFPKEKKKKLNAELANGRLAMMAIIGMLLVKGSNPFVDF